MKSLNKIKGPFSREVRLLPNEWIHGLISEQKIMEEGYPAYTTGCGWLGYDEDRIAVLCREALTQGFTRFKAKVGDDIDQDIKRLTLIRREIGYDNTLMVDANQKWDVDVAIDWMTRLAPFKPLWIEEPTAPDDILGHSKIAKVISFYRSTSCLKIGQVSRRSTLWVLEWRLGNKVTIV